MRGRGTARWASFAPVALMIAATACFASCGSPSVSDLGGSSSPTPPDGRHHFPGFADPLVHGPALRKVVEDCRSCHGQNLDGGAAVGCDGCHATGWRTNCTYCHGGSVADTNGAPPRDLDGQTNPAMITFTAHTKHIQLGIHQAYSCNQCHTMPANALSTNHIFDSTHGKAEVTFAGGLSNQAHYQGNGFCTNLYCHGSGIVPASYDMHQGAPDCKGCHPFENSTSTAWTTMSGKHSLHLASVGANCYECHGTVLNSSLAIISPNLHVNGQVENGFPNTNVTISAQKRCNGLCHGKNHSNNTW